MDSEDQTPLALGQAVGWALQTNQLTPRSKASRGVHPESSPPLPSNLLPYGHSTQKPWGLLSVFITKNKFKNK